MRYKTVFTAKDVKEFDSYNEQRRERDELYHKYKYVLSYIQCMKCPTGDCVNSLPRAQNDVIYYKKKFLDERKHVDGTKSERFRELAISQYFYACAKRILANRIAMYRRLKAKLRELGKQLGFKNAKEVRDGE